MTEDQARPAIVHPGLNLGAGFEEWDQVSVGGGRAYRIFLFRPPGTPPPEGYPVVILPDGNTTFATAAQQASLRIREGEIRPAIIVGVGYPIRDPSETRLPRLLDLTPPGPPAAFRPGMTADTAIGGADDFLDFILGDLMPRIAQRHPVDPSKLTLVGNSVGGLFALHAIFTRPQAFSTYVCGSTSLYWWTEQALADRLSRLGDYLATAPVPPRVLMTVGGLEEWPQDGSPPPMPLMPQVSIETVQAINRMGRMIEDARRLTERLRALPAQPGYEVEFVVFDGETHVSVIPSTISRALGFALRP